MRSLIQSKIHIGGRQHVSPQEVILLTAEINYTVIYFSDGQKTIVATSLKYLEERLRHCPFFRTHRSYIVNLNYIRKITSSSVFLSNGQEIELARRRKVGLKEALSRLEIFYPFGPLTYIPN